MARLVIKEVEHVGNVVLVLHVAAVTAGWIYLGTVAKHIFQIVDVTRAQDDVIIVGHDAHRLVVAQVVLYSCEADFTNNVFLGVAWMLCLPPGHDHLVKVGQELPSQ
jgi:hypothetical protein